MAESKINAETKVGSVTRTTDNAGRVLIPIEIERLVSVWVSEAYMIYPRYMPASPSETMVYVRDPNSFTPITSASMTFYYRYI